MSANPASRKQKNRRAVKTAPEPSTSLYDVNVCGPDRLKISDVSQNEALITEWWERSKLFAVTVQAFARVPMLCFDAETGDWYWASVEERPDV